MFLKKIKSVGQRHVYEMYTTIALHSSVILHSSMQADHARARGSEGQRRERKGESGRQSGKV